MKHASTPKLTQNVRKHLLVHINHYIQAQAHPMVKVAKAVQAEALENEQLVEGSSLARQPYKCKAVTIQALFPPLQQIPIAQSWSQEPRAGQRRGRLPRRLLPLPKLFQTRQTSRRENYPREDR